MGLFDEQVARLPDNYPWAKEFIKSVQHNLWTEDKFDFKGDKAQFLSELTDQERQIVVRCLSAIGQVEVNVKKFWARIGDRLPHPAIYDVGYTMAYTEVVHNHAYQKLLEELDLEHVFDENLLEPVVKGRVEYLHKHAKQAYDSDRQQFIYSIILFTLFVENVSLFSQFYIILWFNRFKGSVLKDTAQQVQYTRNEEMLHAQLGIKIINTLRVEYPELFTEELRARVMEECQVALECESKIIDWMLGDYEGKNISGDLLKAYIQDRITSSLAQIGFTTPFEPVDEATLAKTYWMTEENFGNNVTDFFHKDPVDYQKHNRSYDSEDLF